jgi:hypothetical protein
MTELVCKPYGDLFSKLYWGGGFHPVSTKCRVPHCVDSQDEASLLLKEGTNSETISCLETEEGAQRCFRLPGLWVAGGGGPSTPGRCFASGAPCLLPTTQSYTSMQHAFYTSQRLAHFPGLLAVLC